jgi:microcin C transport system substrate-binding protein
VRDKVPPEVFTTPYKNPVGGSREAMRDNLRHAIRLLKEAGYEVRNRRMVNVKTGEPLSFEVLLLQPTFERVVLFMRPSLERLGIDVTVRTVDESQYENRLRNWDFDMIIGSWPESLSPGNEQREFWGSASADREGSRNLVGIKDPAVDKLIDQVIFAKSRDDLLAATHALDRVLLWNAYVVPQWTSTSLRYAYWKRFDHPSPLPRYSLGFPDIWWASSAKAGAGSDAEAPAPAPKATPDANTAPNP